MNLGLEIDKVGGKKRELLQAQSDRYLEELKNRTLDEVINKSQEHIITRMKELEDEIKQKEDEYTKDLEAEYDAYAGGLKSKVGIHQRHEPPVLQLISR